MEKTDEVALSATMTQTIVTSDATTRDSRRDSTDAIENVGSMPGVESTPGVSRIAASFFRIGPLSGLAALVLALCLLFASFGILYGSNGERVDRWKPWEPTVWLAIFTAASNKLIAFAAFQGVVVSWWRKASRGTTLRRLHTDWSYGLHAWRALFAGRDFNALALACLCATFVAIDGPLLQRASTVALVNPNTPIDLAVSVSPEIPAYWSGSVIFPKGLNGSYTKTSNEFRRTLNDWIASRTINGAVTGCSGVCKATILAPALATSTCYSTYHYRNFSAPLPPDKARAYNDAVKNGINVLPPDERGVYSVALGVANDFPAQHEQLILQTNISDTAVAETCAGQINSTRCLLVPAIAAYATIVNEDGSVAVADEHALKSPNIVHLANNSALTSKTIAENGLREHDNGYIRTTLGGFADAANAKWEFQTALLPSSVVDGGPPVYVWGCQSVWTEEQQTTNLRAERTGKACAPTWADPRDDVMTWLNTLMFYTGVWVAREYDNEKLTSMLDPGVQIHYNVTGHLQSPTNVFKSNMNFFAGAATLQIFSILAILFTFYGWWSMNWRSGSVSFSPLELAKAFDAPLLRDVPSDCNGTAIARRSGGHVVKYCSSSRPGSLTRGKGPEAANQLTFVEMT